MSLGGERTIGCLYDQQEEMWRNLDREVPQTKKKKDATEADMALFVMARSVDMYPVPRGRDYNSLYR